MVIESSPIKLAAYHQQQRVHVWCSDMAASAGVGFPNQLLGFGSQGVF